MQLPKDISNQLLAALIIIAIFTAIGVAYLVQYIRSIETVKETEILNLNASDNAEKFQLNQ
jgi:type II secretory pathway pseudopilin PulG